MVTELILSVYLYCQKQIARSEGLDKPVLSYQRSQLKQRKQNAPHNTLYAEIDAEMC